MHDRRDGVEEGERVLARERADRGGEIGRGERAGGDDDAVPFLRRQRHFAARQRNERLRRQRRRNRIREPVAVHGKRAAGGNLLAVRRAHDQRAEPAHFGVQQADCVVFLVVGAERIRADQFSVAIGLVRGGRAQRPHFMQLDRDAGLRQLPGGFRAGEAAADDVDRFRDHGRNLGIGPGHGNAKKENALDGRGRVSDSACSV